MLMREGRSLPDGALQEHRSHADCPNLSSEEKDPYASQEILRPHTHQGTELSLHSEFLPREILYKAIWSFSDISDGFFLQILLRPQCLPDAGDLLLKR